MYQASAKNMICHRRIPVSPAQDSFAPLSCKLREQHGDARFFTTWIYTKNECVESTYYPAVLKRVDSDLSNVRGKYPGIACRIASMPVNRSLNLRPNPGPFLIRFSICFVQDFRLWMTTWYSKDILPPCP